VQVENPHSILFYSILFYSILFYSIPAICKRAKHVSVQQQKIANLVLIAFIEEFYKQEYIIE